MKLECAFIVALTLLLTACNRTTHVTESAPLKCGGTDDTAYIYDALQNSPQIGITGTCAVENLKIPTNHAITCEAGTLKKRGSDTSYLLDQNGETVTITNCTLDGANQPLHNDHQELCRLNGGNYTFVNVTIKNVGQRGGPNLTDALRAWNSALTVTSSTALDNNSGRIIYFDPNRTLKPLTLTNNHFGHLGNSAIWAGNNGGIYPASMTIQNNVIEDCQDDTNSTGEAGNAIQIWQSENAVIQNNTLNGNRFSGIRLAKVRHSLVTGNFLSRNNEVSMYCAELGGSGNLCSNNMILDFQTGISSTNQEQRQYQDEPDVITNNYLRHGASMGIVVQGSIASNNVIDGAAIGIRIGIGKSKNHIIRNNTCISSDGTPVAACAVIQYDIPGGTDLMESNTNKTAAPGILAANMGMWQRIAGVTKGTATTIHTASGGTSPKTGQTACLSGLFGTTQLNGRCGTVTSTGANQYTIDIDSTNMGDFADPGGGQEGYSWVAAKSDRTPAYPMPNTLILRDAGLPLANLSGLKDGSDFVVPDAICQNGQVVAGAGQVRVFKQAGRYVCQ